jgi:hypothetical protein
MASVDTDSYTAVPVQYWVSSPGVRGQYVVTAQEFTFCDCHSLYWHEEEMWWLDDSTPVCDLKLREWQDVRNADFRARYSHTK